MEGDERVRTFGINKKNCFTKQLNLSKKNVLGVLRMNDGEKGQRSHAPLSSCRRTTRACAPCVQRVTWVVYVRESRVKTVDWWRVLVTAQDLNHGVNKKSS